MASNACIVLALVVTAIILGTHAGDPDITTDFVVSNGVTPNAEFFTFKGLKQALEGTKPTGSQLKVTKASEVEFQALVGQSVSMAILQFGPGGVNAPHTHPRASELLLILKGRLEVGFVDTTNKLFTQTLWAGETFVFPKGMVHFQRNPDAKYPAVAVAAFGSANSGTVALPLALFASRISNDVLAKSFKVDETTIEKLLWSTIQS